MEWLKWKEQGELALSIRDWIDTGSYRKLVIKNVIEESGGKYTEDQVDKKISELKEKYLIIEGSGSLHVTEWATGSLDDADGFEGLDYDEIMDILFKAKVYHPHIKDRK